MISLRRKKSILAAVAVTSFALVASAVPANAEVGVSSTEIKLGTTVPMTGIAAPGYSRLPRR
jgi:branched-chain amino acid transport system substrate-binding protein